MNQFLPDTKENLKKDRRVLGKEWKNTYHGFFGDKKVAIQFVKTVSPLIKTPNPSILYVASGNGLIGEELVKELKEKNKKPVLTILDASKKHLNENKNKNTKKICADIMKFIPTKKYDAVLMRSSLDYFNTERKQIRVLKKINNLLARDGVFINQPASLTTKKDRDTADKIYSSTQKIGKRHFQCDADLKNIYKKAHLTLTKIHKGPKLILNEQDHVKRYLINKNEIIQIQKIIKTTKSTQIRNTRTGYEMNFVFPIYLSRKN